MLTFCGFFCLIEVLLEKQVCGVTTVLSSFKGNTLYSSELGQKIKILNCKKYC